MKKPLVWPIIARAFLVLLAILIAKPGRCWFVEPRKRPPIVSLEVGTVLSNLSISRTQFAQFPGAPDFSKTYEASGMRAGIGFGFTVRPRKQLFRRGIAPQVFVGFKSLAYAFTLRTEQHIGTTLVNSNTQEVRDRASMICLSPAVAFLHRGGRRISVGASLGPSFLIPLKSNYNTFVGLTPKLMVGTHYLMLTGAYTLPLGSFIASTDKEIFPSFKVAYAEVGLTFFPQR